MDSKVFIVVILGIVSVYRTKSAVPYSKNPCLNGSFPLKNQHCERGVGFLPCPLGSFCMPAPSDDDSACCPFLCQYGLPKRKNKKHFVKCQDRRKKKNWCRGGRRTYCSPEYNICCEINKSWIKALKRAWN